MDFISLLQNVTQTAISPSTAAFAIAAIGLNIHFGYTGLINMGVAGFMLVGAYGFAISIRAGVPIGIAVIIGILASVLFGLVLGIPTLQLRGDYLAIVTISAAEIIRMIGRSSVMTNLTGGSNGLTGATYREPFTNLSPLGNGTTTILWFTYSNTGVNGWWARIVTWGVALILCLFVFLIIRSPWGRVLKGIREDEDAVRSLGKNVYSYKMQALLLGGGISGLAGVLYILPSSLQPDALGRSSTFFIFTALLLGGAATIFGPLVGSIIFFSLRVLIQGLAGGLLPASVMSSQQAFQFSWVLVGIALILLVIFRPQGLLGNKKELSFRV